jgi:hypothetical protein
MKVKLLCNLIANDGSWHNRGEFLDDATLPEHIRNDPKLVTGDLDPREGRVLLLRSVIYTAYQYDPVSKQQVGYPLSLTAGQSVALEDIPERQRFDWQEGVHFKTDWTESDQKRLQYEENERYMKQFTVEEGYIGVIRR